MTKTRRQMAEYIKQVDAVCEVVDARIPQVSRNPDMDEIAAGKPRMMILNRIDLADPNMTAVWAKHFREQGMAVIQTDSRSGNGTQAFSGAVRTLLADKIAQWNEKGLVGKSVRVMVVGIPNVGKSTMLLQLCGAISNQHSVLYITGEESVRQVKLRAARLKVPQDNIFLAAENDVDEICGLIEKEKPDLVVIDSIQTMRCMDISSSSGTVSQVKESAARLLAVAKKQEIPMFIVGHVNKDGAIAGPKVMEHIVDTVLYFEGDKMLPYRILRAAKNRYGSTNELGMFDMTGTGLAEIENPSQMLLEGRPLGVSGNCVACTMEGSRPILSEIQALATKTNFPAPRRACSGYDYNRMNLLIAVLEKRAGYFFGNLDVYVNIVGGIALRDTACDLSVCLSMVSSLLDRPVSDKLIAIGEVGLGGEVRSVPNLEQRLHEAERIGFERAVVPKHSLNHLNPADYPGMKLIGAAYISDAINALKTDRL